MLKQTLSVIHRLEDTALVFVFTSALMLALAQILLRNVFDIGFLWLESLLKIQVLWLALQGAMIGTRQGRHIRIDLLTRILPEQAAALVGRLVALFSAVICTMCASASRELVLFERMDGLTAFADVPIWVCQLILPIGFGVMALRFLINAVLPIKDGASG